MAPNTFICFATLFVTGAALVTDVRNSAFLKSAMQPDRVAHTLTGVEREWEAQAWAFADCTSTSKDTSCNEAPSAFHTSCAKVAGAIFSASEGVLATTREYMNDVCEIVKSSASYQTCSIVGTAMLSQMSASEVDNRENSGLHSDKACDSLWEFFVDKEKSKKEKVLAETNDADDKEEKKTDEKQTEKKEEKKVVRKNDKQQKKINAKKEEQKSAAKPEDKKPAGAKNEDLSKKMPLKAAEQGFKGKKVQHKDGKTHTSDWRSEYGAEVGKEAAPKKSGSIRSVLSVTMLIAPALSLLM